MSERLVARFCKAVIALSDEPLTFFLDEDETHCVVSVRAPAMALEEEPSLGLRLVLGLARIAGGDLVTSGDRLKLLLPKP